MFVRLNERVYLNLSRITRTKLTMWKMELELDFMKEKTKLQNQKI